MSLDPAILQDVRVEQTKLMEVAQQSLEVMEATKTDIQVLGAGVASIKDNMDASVELVRTTTGEQLAKTAVIEAGVTTLTTIMATEIAALKTENVKITLGRDRTEHALGLKTQAVNKHDKKMGILQRKNGYLQETIEEHQEEITKLKNDVDAKDMVIAARDEEIKMFQKIIAVYHDRERFMEGVDLSSLGKRTHDAAAINDNNGGAAAAATDNGPSTAPEADAPEAADDE